MGIAVTGSSRRLGIVVAGELCAAGTVRARPSAELVAEVLLRVETRGFGERDPLPSFDKARYLLGCDPRNSWRDHDSGS